MSRDHHTLRFPALYEHWRRHDLVYARDEFYHGLGTEDELRVWFEWGSEGLWANPFPGSFAAGILPQKYVLSTTRFVNLSSGTVMSWSFLVPGS